MTTRKKLEARAAALGATIVFDSSGGWPEITVEAPAGKIWNDGDLIHQLVIAGERGEKVTDLYGDAWIRMLVGVVACPLGAECEWCNSPVEVQS